MKYKVIPLIIVLILTFGLFGCKELEEIKPFLIEEDGLKILSAYENKVVMIFVYNETDKDYFLNVFNFDTNQYVCFGFDPPGENEMRKKYFAYRSECLPTEWSEEDGILVMYPPFGGETKYVSKKEFFEMIQPFMDKIMEQKKAPMESLREAAIDIGLLESESI